MKDEALKIPVGTIIIARVTGNAYHKTRAGWVRVESVAVCRAMVRRRGR